MTFINIAELNHRNQRDHHKYYKVKHKYNNNYYKIKSFKQKLTKKNKNTQNPNCKIFAAMSNALTALSLHTYQALEQVYR